MLETSDVVEPVYPAATIVLLRDGQAGLEALLVQRSREVKHMGGMWVFPGGKVDETDYSGNSDDYSAAVNAAIRETREEAGLEVHADQLTYLSHWTTPEGAKRRFATWFFVAILREHQEVQVDGGEIARHRWVKPTSALDESASAEHGMRLMPPTYVSLVHIADCETCAQVSERLSVTEPLVYAPRMVQVEGGICFLYAADAGYRESALDAEGRRHRLYMVNDQLDYVCDD